MTENEEKLAEEYAGKKCGRTNKFSPICSGCAVIKLAYLDGIAHERKKYSSILILAKALVLAHHYDNKEYLNMALSDMTKAISEYETTKQGDAIYDGDKKI